MPLYSYKGNYYVRRPAGARCGRNDAWICSQCGTIRKDVRAIMRPHPKGNSHTVRCNAKIAHALVLEYKVKRWVTYG